MKITALKVVNYKGFLDSDFIELSGSWNVVVGQNNAGKTAFMEGFRLGRNENRHHKNSTFPRDFAYPTQSLFLARMAIGRGWLKTAWLKRGGHFDLPVSGSGGGGNQAVIDPNDFWDGEDLHIELEFQQGNNVRSGWPSHRLFQAPANHLYVQIHPTPDRKIGQITGPVPGDAETLPTIIQQTYAAHIYAFDAKRFALGECVHEDTSILRPDAGNLPAVLLKLAGNPDLFREFNQNVRAIFPSIKGVTVTTKGGHFEIRVWPIELARISHAAQS